MLFFHFILFLKTTLEKYNEDLVANI